MHSERAFVFCIPCFKFERLRTSHNISVASGGAEGSDVNFNVAPRPSFLRLSGDSWALQYYTLTFTMILNFVACLGAKNSNVASDRCQVEFDDYCALLHSRFMFLQVFFCILYSSIFCILYSSVLWQRQRGFGSMWSWIWKQPQQIVGTATGVVWLDNFSAHCSLI